MKDKMIRIGVFYDGNYFLHISNYYNYEHERGRRLSISGLHNFIRHQVGELEGVDASLCQIVDSHYFRTRLNAQEASQRGDTLYWDRVFDDILMSEGITTHYLPLKSYNGYRQEKDIDVWLALEAFELAFYKHFDVLVLIASDGNFVPLIRKLNTLGTRVMVLSWEFEYTTDNGQTFVTRTSQDLLDQVSYPVAMHELIDNPRRKTDVLINNLFVSPPGKRAMGTPLGKGNPDALNGEILSLKNGFGFIRYPPNNLFFHYTSVVDDDFNDLRVGDLVEFNLGKNDVGEDIAQEVRLVD
ncbi:MAG: NYN domain-containing protein [Saprospiraceae bacterium]|jgi:uncharacterized LabA/DUF88 family protein/cold shock CspA family protein|nr:NYN domain-containing protein [Saprospiraceae bacterium]MBP9209223.1 NYN domain-containing protein [Saprospiraceae bacterium]